MEFDIKKAKNVRHFLYPTHFPRKIWFLSCCMSILRKLKALPHFFRDRIQHFFYLFYVSFHCDVYKMASLDLSKENSFNFLRTILPFCVLPCYIQWVIAHKKGNWDYCCVSVFNVIVTVGLTGSPAKIKGKGKLVCVNIEVGEGAAKKCYIWRIYLSLWFSSFSFQS